MRADVMFVRQAFVLCFFVLLFMTELSPELQTVSFRPKAGEKKRLTACVDLSVVCVITISNEHHVTTITTPETLYSYGETWHDLDVLLERAVVKPRNVAPRCNATSHVIGRRLALVAR